MSTTPYRQRRPSGGAMRFDDTEPTTVYLVRHGETAATDAKTLSGSSEPGPPLTGVGRDQATRVANLLAARCWPDLAPPAVLVASPMVRTQETAAIVGERLALPARTAAAFAECDFGDWQGLTAAQIEARWPGDLRRWYTDPTFPAPGGESLQQVGARVSDGLRELAGGVVVVSHVMAIRAAVGATLQLAPAHWPWLRVQAGSLTVLQLWGEMSEVVALGVLPRAVT